MIVENTGAKSQTSHSVGDKYWTVRDNENL